MTTIAFLGIGLMGTGSIRHARAQGLTVRAWNRSAAKPQRCSWRRPTVLRAPA
jgi:3-hydroxyisobutyrate dehydrogenase-like beta-hydroxyacid dehydrogenase